MDPSNIIIVPITDSNEAKNKIFDLIKTTPRQKRIYVFGHAERLTMIFGGKNMYIGEDIKELDKLGVTAITHYRCEFVKDLPETGYNLKFIVPINYRGLCLNGHEKISKADKDDTISHATNPIVERELNCDVKESSNKNEILQAYQFEAVKEYLLRHTFSAAGASIKNPD